jgi:flagellar biosynthetic protein FliQ
MSIEQALSIIKNALTTIMLVGGPVLIVSLVVGILISLFQALTQIHEATLAFAPKILIVFIVLIILGGWMLGTLVDYSKHMFIQMGSVLPR